MITSSIVKQHLNIVVCNCNTCMIDNKICFSRLQTVIRAIEEQIQTIKDETIIEEKKEILKIIKMSSFEDLNNPYFCCCRVCIQRSEYKCPAKIDYLIDKLEKDIEKKQKELQDLKASKILMTGTKNLFSRPLFVE
jgi:hypothetical protein